MRQFLILTLFVFLTVCSQKLSAQTEPFVLVQNSGLPDLAHSWVAWGDYDRDGDLDIAICGDSAGIPRTYVYRNDNGFFVNSGFTLPNLTNGCVEWGDADNNGWLDLLITGVDAGGETKAYIIPNSNGDLGAPPVLLPFAVSHGQAHWGDYDNDGKLDIIMAGNNIAKILHNNGSMSFSGIAAPLPALSYATCNWVDYNNDGQPDAFVSGHTTAGDVSKLYRNDHSVFTEVNIQPSGFQGLSYGSSKWADLNQDGKMDLLLSGEDTVMGYVLIYKNKGNDVFEKIDTYTFNMFSTNMDIADYDNDGLPDIIINGKILSCGATSLTILLHNEGFMMFTNPNTDISGIAVSGTAFADYNNDGYTDLLMSGTGSLGETATMLYRNTSGSSQFFTNTPPLQPANLTAQQNGNAITLRWNKASDAQTPPDGLMYNIFIGSSNDTMDVFNPMSDYSTGFRRIASAGNTNQDTSWTVSGLGQGSYYWSVQAIDNGFMPSVFAPVHTFSYTPTGIPGNNPVENKIYPNPCKDRIYLNIPDPSKAGVSVFNSRGNMVMNCMYADGIDVSELPSGLYFALIQTNDKIYKSSFLKK